MAKQLIVVFPRLEAKRAFNGHTTSTFAELLGISEDSVRRRLRGEVEFELPEILKLMSFYNCTFEELFGREEIMRPMVAMG
ncbi:MAG: helix-turn-helix transcriptional regulator [Lachnospiraceae bacterium]|nr:helix-turn-helix transcriptional regulator [Lachnospiraceae bacterium]